MKHSLGEMTSKTNEDPRSGQGTSRGRDRDSKNSSIVNLKIVKNHSDYSPECLRTTSKISKNGMIPEMPEGIGMFDSSLDGPE